MSEQGNNSQHEHGLDISLQDETVVLSINTGLMQAALGLDWETALSLGRGLVKAGAIVEERQRSKKPNIVVPGGSNGN